MDDTAKLYTETESGAERLEIRVWLRLLASTNLIAAGIRQRLQADHDTTLPRFDVLAQLVRAGGPLSMGELSRRLMVSNGNVTGVVERLARDGLVARAQAPSDRRRWLVTITEDGRRFFAEVARDHHAFVARLMRELGRDELRALDDGLARLKSSAAAADQGEDER